LLDLHNLDEPCNDWLYVKKQKDRKKSGYIPVSYVQEITRRESSKEIANVWNRLSSRFTMDQLRDVNVELLNTIGHELETDQEDSKITVALSPDEERRFYVLKEFLDTEKQYGR
jgi:hypothetical protein